MFGITGKTMTVGMTGVWNMKRVSVIFVIIAGILWGSSCIFVYGLSFYGLNSIHISFIRGGVASVLTVIFALAKDKKLFHTAPFDLLLYFGGGVSMLMTSVLYYGAMQKTSVATAVILMYTAPIFVMGYSVLFFKERLTKKKFAVTVIMLVGSCLVSGAVGGIKFNPAGILLGFGSGIAYSSYNIFTKIQMKRQCNPFTASMYSFIFMTLIGAFVSSPRVVFETAEQNPISLMWIFSCGFVTSVLPYLLYAKALRRLPVSTASSLAVVEPLTATMFGFLFFSQIPDSFSIYGTLLVLISVFMLSKLDE